MNDATCPAAAYQALQKVILFQYFHINTYHFPDTYLIVIEVYHEIKFRIFIFIEKCKVAIVYEHSGQPTYIVIGNGD